MVNEKSPFEMYSEVLKAWGDVFGSWAKSMSGGPFFKAAEMENWFKPFTAYFGDWSKISESYRQSMTGFPWPHQAMKDYSDAMMQGINSYVQIYNGWIKNAEKIGKKQLQVVQDMATGKEVRADDLFETLKESYDDVSRSFFESLKGVPYEEVFKGLEELTKAVKQFADSFPEEQKQVKETLQAYLDACIKVTNTWSTSMGEAGKTFSDMLGKGEISANAYKKMINLYVEAAKESTDTLWGSLAFIIPNQKDMIDDLTDWSDKYFDLLAFWLDVPYKVLQEMRKSSTKLQKLAEETFRKGKIPPPEELYNTWSEFYQKSIADLIKGVDFSANVPALMNNFIEYTKSTNKLYSRIMTPPYPSKEEMGKVYSMIKETAKVIEKKTKSASAEKKG